MQTRRELIQALLGGAVAAAVGSKAVAKPALDPMRDFDMRGRSGLDAIIEDGPSGIALPTVLVGTRLYTSIEALKWWVAATSAAPRCRANVVEERLPMRPDTRRTLEAAGLL